MWLVLGWNLPALVWVGPSPRLWAEEAPQAWVGEQARWRLFITLWAPTQYCEYFLDHRVNFRTVAS